MKQSIGNKGFDGGNTQYQISIPALEAIKIAV